MSILHFFPSYFSFSMKMFVADKENKSHLRGVLIVIEFKDHKKLTKLIDQATKVLTFIFTLFLSTYLSLLM